MDTLEVLDTIFVLHPASPAETKRENRLALATLITAVAGSIGAIAAWRAVKKAHLAAEATERAARATEQAAKATEQQAGVMTRMYDAETRLQLAQWRAKLKDAETAVAGLTVRTASWVRSGVSVATIRPLIAELGEIVTRLRALYAEGSALHRPGLAGLSSAIERLDDIATRFRSHDGVFASYRPEAPINVGSVLAGAFPEGNSSPELEAALNELRRCVAQQE